MEHKIILIIAFAISAFLLSELHGVEMKYKSRKSISVMEYINKIKNR